MRHNQRFVGSRKASYERTILILAIVFVIGLCSCGIRPINRPDNNISGMDTTYMEETDPPESETVEETRKPIRDPITLAPESYPHEYYPGEMGTGVNPHQVLSYLADEEYIKDHTVGYFYIQNKGTGLFLTSWHVLYYGSLTEEQKYQMNLILHDIENATLFQMIELDNDHYAFLSIIDFAFQAPAKTKLALELTQFKQHQGCANMGFPVLYNLWAQSFIIKKTPSGAYTMTTRLMDMHTDCVIGLKFCTQLEGQSYYIMFYNGPYVEDDDYSDEWLFIPAEPPETEAP